MKLLLILVSIIGVGAVIGAVVVGTRTFDDTVVDKPYERGLSYDAVHHEKEASGWNAEILNREFTIGTNSISVSVIDRNRKPVTDVEVSLMVSRPSTSSYDRTYKASVTENGQFRVTAELPLYGYWDAKVQIRDSVRSVIFARTLFAERKQP